MQWGVPKIQAPSRGSAQRGVRSERSDGASVVVRLPGVTSTTNARELERLRKARMQAQERFAKQMELLEQIAATAGAREAITRRWNGQLAALAELSGGAANAAELSGLPKADIETAVNRAVDRADLQAVTEAANPAARRRRKPAEDAASDRMPGDGAAASAASPAG
jgi:superfamily II DNA or RNA helicase